LIRLAAAALALLAASTVAAAPRWYAPPVLRAGSVNELYAWDTAPVGAFTVEVTRDGAAKPLVRAHGFEVDRPLPEDAPGTPGLKWSAALLAPDALEAGGPVTVRFLGADRAVLAAFPSRIQPRIFPVETIPLDEQMSRLREKPDARKDREYAAIWAVYSHFDPAFAWPGGPIVLPVAPTVRLSARFGDTRKYLYADGSIATDYHRGVDFAVPVGTPVQAPGPGTVIFVADRMLTGHTVVIEHAPGVYSVYFHLSQALVTPGTRVLRGDRIALSGATGFVTGPHLHWEWRVGGVSVDPLELVATGLLDTAAVGAVISSIERPSH
jgi:murein DD-endopeptidase MepM/ murein hydrolase activator NlpD